MGKYKGWVKIHRSILDDDLSASQFKFLVASIMLADTVSSKEPGRVNLSMRQLAQELKISSTDVYRHEHYLAKQGTIILEKQGFVIVNYQKYQGHKCYTHVTVDTPESVTPKEQPKKIGVTPAEQPVTPTEQSVTPAEQPVTPTEQSVTNSVPASPYKNKKNIYKNIKNIEEVPDFINKEVFNAFLEMRKSIKSPPTPKAIKLIFGELEKLKNAGEDPNKILEKSIINNWKGVFPVNGGSQSGYGTGKSNAKSASHISEHFATPEEHFGPGYGHTLPDSGPPCDAEPDDTPAK